jgi:hypothetical protein
MPRDPSGLWRLLTIAEALDLVDSHPALQGREPKEYICKLRDNGANKSFAFLGHYLDYLGWLRLQTQRPQGGPLPTELAAPGGMTRRQISYFPGRAACFADQIKAGHVEPEKARHFADKIEQLTSGVWGTVADDAPAKLRSLAENPQSPETRRLSASALQDFVENLKKADALRTVTFFQHRRHLTRAHSLAARFLRALRKETGFYQMEFAVKLFDILHKGIGVNLDYSEPWLRKILCRQNSRLGSSAK